MTKVKTPKATAKIVLSEATALAIQTRLSNVVTEQRQLIHRMDALHHEVDTIKAMLKLVTK